MKNTIQITERPDLTTSQILALCKEKFSVWSYYDDAQLDKDFPAPKEATVRHFLKEPEPDKETLGLSVREAEDKGFTSGITIRERLLLELAYFTETGEHLDIKGVTFCSGSRDSDGGVPLVRWRSDNRKVQVNWCRLGSSDSKYGLRSAVSLSSPSFSPSGELEKAIELVKSNGYKVIKEM